MAFSVIKKDGRLPSFCCCLLQLITVYGDKDNILIGENNMPFGMDVENDFISRVGGGTYNEVQLFGFLKEAIISMASAYCTNVASVQVHKSYVSFEESKGLYFVDSDSGTVCCEIADLMFVVCTPNESRLCYMQNKLDKRHMMDDTRFSADMRQMYLLREKPYFTKGRSFYKPGNALFNNARYSSITNYGVFKIKDDQYTMNYYNAEVLNKPVRSASPNRVVIQNGMPQYSSIDAPKDQLEYAYGIEKFCEGLINLKIGEKYIDINKLLSDVNSEEINDQFRKWNNNINPEYDKNLPQIVARENIIICIK